MNHSNARDFRLFTLFYLGVVVFLTACALEGSNRAGHVPPAFLVEAN